MRKNRIALACQGGGSNGAFTYGVLREILQDMAKRSSANANNAYEIVSISGTSAGALNAFAAWYGLAEKHGLAGSSEEAIRTLDRLWRTFQVTTASEKLFNNMLVQALRAESRGLPTVRMSPYSFIYELLLSRLGLVGLRPEFYDFAALLEAVAPDFQAIDQGRTPTRLFVGAVDVLAGTFEAFDSWAPPESHRNISLAAIRASGTLPEVRKAEPISDITGQDGVVRDGLFWDGLFSQNPPVREFVSGFAADKRPDEIWVIRINPQTRATPPTCPDEIEDRRNELSGNLSLNQELRFLQDVNDWCATYGDFAANHKRIVIRTIKMSRSVSDSLDLASKFDRAPEFIARLRKDGEQQAASWLARWPDAVGTWPADAIYGPDEVANTTEPLKEKQLSARG
ncbi:MAG: patatin-like phospholipase family protein [Hyphomicrobiales bacterium]|nr:patatin-like phospholipase family protein [Hyphomicrobiales bacterium]